MKVTQCSTVGLKEGLWRRGKTTAFFKSGRTTPSSKEALTITCIQPHAMSQEALTSQDGMGPEHRWSNLLSVDSIHFLRTNQLKLRQDNQAKICLSYFHKIHAAEVPLRGQMSNGRCDRNIKNHEKAWKIWIILPLFHNDRSENLPLKLNGREFQDQQFLLYTMHSWTGIHCH